MHTLIHAHAHPHAHTHIHAHTHNMHLYNIHAHMHARTHTVINTNTHNTRARAHTLTHTHFTGLVILNVVGDGVVYYLCFKLMRNYVVLSRCVSPKAQPKVLGLFTVLAMICV